MKYLEKINSLQIEISSNCNLHCPGCARIDQTTNGIHKLIKKNVFLNLDIIKELLKSKYLQDLDYIDFCGSIDDPLMHPNFLEILEYITEKNIKVIVQTNASYRTTDYWKQMANILNKKASSYVKFSIDGLEDTNHLYRKGANWKKIIDNATSFINNGGNAQWQFIIFPWNKHQVEEARTLSEEIGFKSFRYRHDRSDVTLDDNKIKQQTKMFTEKTKRSWKEFSNELNEKAISDSIECYAKNEKQFFITHEGKVWPCCFLHNYQYSYVNKYREYEDRFKLNYKENWNNLYHYTFDEIFNHKFFQNDLVSSWSSATHGSSSCDRLIRCTQTCSKNNFKIGGHKIIDNIKE